MINKLPVFIFLLVFACKNGRQSTNNQLSIDQIIESHIGNTYETFDRGNLLLCVSPDKSTNGTWNTILVINKASGEIIYGPEKLNAQVNWHTDSQLMITEYPEIVSDKQGISGSGYIYDLISKQRINPKL